MAVRNRLYSQKDYGQAPIVYKLARKKNKKYFSSYNKSAFEIRGIKVLTKKIHGKKLLEIVKVTET